MTQPELQTKGLVKRFGANTILDGIDFSLAKGEVAVILGPSGCGKSTFLRCLIGLETIDAGEVLLKVNPSRTRARCVTASEWCFRVTTFFRISQSLKT